MKRLLSILAAVAVLALPATPAWAQSNLCIIDIGKVFKASEAFNQEMARLKAEADQFEVKLGDAQKQLATMNEQLRKLNAAEPAYREKENEIAQFSAEWEVNRRSKLRELMQRESQLHFETYLAINGLIGEFCQANGVSVVLRFNSDPMSLDDPESIMQTFNNSVVYYAPQRNITDRIIQMMATNAPAPKP